MKFLTKHYYILIKEKDVNDNVFDLVYGGLTKVAAKRVLHDYRNYKSPSEEYIVLIVRMVGTYNNFMAFTKGFQNNEGLALPDESELRST